MPAAMGRAVATGDVSPALRACGKVPGRFRAGSGASLHRAISRLSLGYLSATSRLSLGCLSAVSPLYLGYLSAVPRLYLGYFSVTSRLYLGVEGLEELAIVSKEEGGERIPGRWLGGVLEESRTRLGGVSEVSGGREGRGGEESVPESGEPGRAQRERGQPELAA